MRRTLEQYAKCDPFQVVSGSHAQALHFAKDAQADIAELAADNDRLRRALEKIDAEDDTGPMMFEDIGNDNWQPVGGAKGKFSKLARAALEAKP